MSVGLRGFPLQLPRPGGSTAPFRTGLSVSVQSSQFLLCSAAAAAARSAATAAAQALAGVAFPSLNRAGLCPAAVQADVGINGGLQDAPAVLSLQPTAIIDHVCIIEEDALRKLVADEVGGSHRVELDEVQRTLTAVGEVSRNTLNRHEAPPFPAPPPLPSYARSIIPRPGAAPPTRRGGWPGWASAASCWGAAGLTSGARCSPAR